MTSQVSDLKGWVKEILNGTFARLVRQGFDHIVNVVSPVAIIVGL